MSGTEQVLAGRSAAANWPRRPAWRVRARRAELTWAIAFLVPYAAVFLAFAVYPIVYALWMGSKLSLYAVLLDDPHYLTTAVNTLLFVGLGVNLMMFLALLL